MTGLISRLLKLEHAARAAPSYIVPKGARDAMIDGLCAEAVSCATWEVFAMGLAGIEQPAGGTGDETRAAAVRAAFARSAFEEMQP
ncbi:MAG: hypothetical protein ABW184_09950 [Sphingobium sp.]